MELKSKTAVITGVSKGIGRATALQLLSEGTIVFGLGRTNTIEHTNYRFIACDVRSISSVEDAFKQVYEASNNEVHILINNAGLGYFGMLEDITYEQWDELFQTNVNGIFYCCKQVLPLMKKQQAGHIVNIASTAALEGMPQISAYCASKWAVKGLSESLFKEVRDYKVKVTCIYPGSVKTDFFRNNPDVKPHDYMLMPEDVASNIVYALKMPDNYHTVNLEIRPLQPKGPVK